ncbi:hypothetical protein [Actinomadura citrea]|uniref:Uncharacterized protein n=1 Tax=Actinomadura citrea TaxID=46158 RepID=A0A7Y9GB26_9ACTN|nr:hypothetical protein [Actinomadura citrea]NYE13213.1 hypothetical protein [Actinomadura citrea]GGU04757.1 hypothetical protein GCM10010177_75080 [Actinomadura citrea]
MELSAGMLRALADGGADLFPLGGVKGLDIGLDEAGVLTVRILVSHSDEPPAGLPESPGGVPYLETTPVIPDADRHDPVLGGHQVGRHDTRGGLTTRAITPPVTPVASRRWRPRSESPCEMRGDVTGTGR